MKKLYWKQTTPLDQLIVIRMSLEGEMDNFANGVTTQRGMMQRVSALLDDLEHLQEFLVNPEAWI